MTEIVFILDRSLSMKRLVSDVIGGFNSVIKRRKKKLTATLLFPHSYHADTRGTQEAFGGISNFAQAFAAAPMFNSVFDDKSWRESIDKDFFDRMKR